LFIRMGVSRTRLHKHSKRDTQRLKTGAAAAEW